MKVTKINGLGSFGVYVDDFDYQDVTQWAELEKINLKYLVTVVRNNGKNCWMDVVKGVHYMTRIRHMPATKLIEKYGRQWQNPEAMDAEDKMAFYGRPNMAVTEAGGLGWSRISGEKNEKGDVLGMFADTELLWHSNASGDACFAPLVMLYGVKGMIGSSTGFAVTADWLNEQTQSFQSELEDLVAIHQWIPHQIEPTGSDLHEAMLKPNFADWQPSEMPLIMTSPGGIKGVHLGQGTITGFKGMSQEESDKLLNHLRSELFSPRWTMDLWWENDTGDLYLFDNSITQHNRTFKEGTDISQALQNRVGYRTGGDYASALDWEPSQMEPWKSQRANRLKLHYALSEDLEITLLINRIWQCGFNEQQVAEFKQNLNTVRPGLLQKLFDLPNELRPGPARMQLLYEKFNIQ